MNDEKIVEKMIEEVRNLVDGKIREKFDFASSNKKTKAVSQQIVRVLEDVIKDEDQKN